MLRAIDKQAQLVEDEIKTLVDNDKQLKHPVKLLLSHFLRFAFLL
jgi:hypothetical protein